jgi:hypothetical protein
MFVFVICIVVEASKFTVWSISPMTRNWLFFLNKTDKKYPAIRLCCSLRGPNVLWYVFVPLNEPCLCVFVPIFLIPVFSNRAPLLNEHSAAGSETFHWLALQLAQPTPVATPSWPPPTGTASQTWAGSWLGLRFFDSMLILIYVLLRFLNI